MENTSDSLMPRPLLLCLKSEKIVCYSVPDNSRRMGTKTFTLSERISQECIFEFTYKWKTE